MTGTALADAFGHDPRVIVEAASPGIEAEVAILGSTWEPEASQVGEIVVKGSRSPGGWYDYAAKYQEGGMELVIPARISVPHAPTCSWAVISAAKLSTVRPAFPGA